ncbi:Flavin-containing monooxygenase, partial [Thalictrum thalictroides]
VVPAIKKFTATGAEFSDGTKAKFDSIIFATGYRSNVASWLKDGELFNQEGHPKTPFPDSWKGKHGLYSVGFTGRGLLGISMDAEKVAEHILLQWNSETKHLRMEL